VTAATTATGSARSRPLAWAATLAVLTLILYWPATGNGFVDYDDDVYVTANSQLRAGLSWDGVVWAFRSTEASNWHPLTWLSHLADVSLFDLDPSGHHATSVVLHALNAALLFLLLQRATMATGASLAVAALFACHPLNVQSVAWVAERKTVLCTLFWLSTLWAYGAWTRRPNALRYGAVVACLTLSLLAKPMAVTIPFVLLLVDAWPLDRWRLGQRRLWGEKAPLFLLAAASSWITFAVQRTSGAVATTEAIPWAARLANAVWSCVAYLEKMVWPAQLAVFYPHPGGALPAWRAALALCCLAAVTAALVRLRGRFPWALVGWLWYLGTLVPVLGIVQVGTQAMADRYAYVPLIGVFVILSWATAALVAAGRLPARAATGIAAAVLVVLSARTLQQIALWHDSITLFEHTTRVEPASWVAHYNLGNAYARLGRQEDAALRFRETIRWRPGFARAHNNLGDALDALGRHDEALPCYEEAVRLKPDLVEAQNNLGIAYADRGRYQQALGAMRTATALRPDFMEAHLNLSITLRQLGRLAEALAEAERAVALRPSEPLPRYHRALALILSGKASAAQPDIQLLGATSPDLAMSLEEALAQGQPRKP
jgi:tetratricopeptide (TPR) repeat protein